MKHILQFVFFFSFAATAFAQSVVIGYPPNGALVKPGRRVTVQIIQPNSIMPPSTLGIALGIKSCVGAPCPAPSDQMGAVLYNGPFNPQRMGSQSYQNFTVMIPSDIASGAAQLNVAYAALVGAGAKPTFDTVSEKLRIS